MHGSNIVPRVLLYLGQYLGQNGYSCEQQVAGPGHACQQHSARCLVVSRTVSRRVSSARYLVASRAVSRRVSRAVSRREWLLL